MQQLLISEPFFFWDPIVVHRASDIYDAELISNTNFNVFGINKCRQNKRRATRYLEVYAANLIALQVQMLVLIKVLRLHQGTNPTNEGGGHALKESNLLVPFLVDVQAHLDPQLVGQRVNKFVHILEVFLVLVRHVAPKSNV